MHPLLDITLYLVALINPVSKVFVLSVLSKDMTRRELNSLAIRSSIIALLALLALASAGEFILTEIFKIDLYSLKIVGGLILLTVGFKAVTRGIFFETGSDRNICELSMVPLASPLIAGPATITAGISFSAQYGPAFTGVAMACAIWINLLIMLSTKSINKFLVRHNLSGALIRMTGMIVATMAVQMLLTGLSDWLQAVGVGV